MNNRKYKPVKLIESLEGINRNLENKFGKIEYVIYSKWPKIVGEFFAEYSKPNKITKVSKFENGQDKYYEKILYVSVASVAAVEFQHFQNKILEKINSFFGYQAIHHIKICQNFSLKKASNDTYTEIISAPSSDFLNQKKNEIKDTTQKINDKELEKSLVSLGLSIAKNKKN